MISGLRRAPIGLGFAFAIAVASSLPARAQDGEASITLTDCFNLLDNGAPNTEIIDAVQRFLATDPPPESQRIALEYSLEAYFLEDLLDKARPVIRKAADLTENGDWQPERFADWSPGLRALVVAELENLMDVYSDTFEVFALEEGEVELNVSTLVGSSPLKVGEEGAMSVDEIAELAIREANQHLDSERPRNVARNLRVQTLERAAARPLEAHGTLRVTIESLGSPDKVDLRAEFLAGLGDAGIGEVRERRIRNQKDLKKALDKLMREAAKAVWRKEAYAGKDWDREMLTVAKARLNDFRDYHAALTTRWDAWQMFDDKVAMVEGLETALAQLEEVQKSSRLFRNSISAEIERSREDLERRRAQISGENEPH